MPSETHKHLRVKTVNGVTVVGLAAGESVFQTKDVEELDGELRRLVSEAAPRKLILSLEGTRYLSSGMLGRLINLQKQVSQAGGQFAVCCPTPVMRDTFRVSKLDQVIELFDDEAAALARF